MRVSVILPAHNEEANIEPMVRGLINAIGNNITEIIIINDASEDRTAEIVKKLTGEFNCVRLVNRNYHPGVGLAIREGLKYVNSNSEWILTSHSDFVATVNDMQLLIKYDIFNK